MHALMVFVAAATVGQYGGGGGGTNYGDWTASASGTMELWAAPSGQRIVGANGVQCDWSASGGPPGGVSGNATFQYRVKPIPGQPGPSWTDSSSTFVVGYGGNNTSTTGNTKTQISLPTSGDYEVRVAFQVPVQKGQSGPGQPVDWKTIYTDAIVVSSEHP